MKCTTFIVPLYDQIFVLDCVVGVTDISESMRAILREANVRAPVEEMTDTSDVSTTDQPSTSAT